MKYKRILLIKEDKRDTIAVDVDRLLYIGKAEIMVSDSPYSLANIETTGGVLRNKALCLDESYDWVLGRNDLGWLYLIPLKK